MRIATRSSLFSLGNIKRDALRGGRAIGGGAAFTTVRDDVLLALCEAMEAADDFVNARYMGSLERLQKALGRFSFDD